MIPLCSYLLANGRTEGQTNTLLRIAPRNSPYHILTNLRAEPSLKATCKIISHMYQKKKKNKNKIK